MTFTDEQVYAVRDRLILTYEPVPVGVCREIMEAAAAMLIKSGSPATAEDVEETIISVLSYRGPSQPGPTNWPAWVGEDFPSRCAEALRAAGLLKENDA